MQKITKSSTAEYFAKNLQQVGFSSSTKAVLTTLKESVDNSLDACEEAGIAPHIKVKIKKEGMGSSKNVDLISVVVEDNGPGLDEKNIAKVFGEYLASSKFGRGRCSRGQQGIGISAATTWAQLTQARGVHVSSKLKNSPKAFCVVVNMDIKNNKGVLKNKTSFHWEAKKQGLKVEFLVDGRVQLKGEGGLITYLEGTALVNPHLELEYELLDQPFRKIERVSNKVPKIPPSSLPHPHTMKLGDFLQHASFYASLSLKKFLKTAFSRITDKSISLMKEKGLTEGLLKKTVRSIGEKDYKHIFSLLYEIDFPKPSSQSVLAVGEEALAESINRLGDIDFFSVITRKPKVCDYKSVIVEVALARLNIKKKEEEGIQLLRFANRVPLQFDKASCAITKSVESVNWRAYGLSQSKKSLPLGPYVFAVSVTSPFIKFKNASKETIDASEELVEEIRLALMQAGQKLKKHIRKEKNTADLIRKKEYIEKFAPILIQKLKDITGASQKEIEGAQRGLYAILSKDTVKAEKALGDARQEVEKLKAKMGSRLTYKTDNEAV
ncbi:MAG: DNA topoisomerase VI subunit B [Bdellovibrionales bacterium]|nr:DNA topoisomerase VI subunit B [Bdellovibrionales bacterium]